MYEAFGAKHPTTSLVVVMVLGALAFGAVWHVAARQYEKGTARNAVTPVTQPSVNNTSGPQSPIMPNNSGTVTITNGEKKPERPAPKE